MSVVPINLDLAVIDGVAIRPYKAVHHRADQSDRHHYVQADDDVYYAKYDLPKLEARKIDIYAVVAEDTPSVLPKALATPGGGPWKGDVPDGIVGDWPGTPVVVSRPPWEGESPVQPAPVWLAEALLFGMTAIAAFLIFAIMFGGSRKK